MKKVWQLSVFVFLFSALFSCKFKNEPKEFTTRRWTPTMAAPLADVNLTLQNMLKSQDIQPFIQEDGDGFLTLVYQDTIFSESVENYVVLPDQSFNQSFKMPDVNIPAFDVQLAYRDSVKGVEAFNAGAADRSLDFIVFKGGQLSINITSTYNQNLDLVVTIPNLKNRNTNQPFVESFTLGANGSVNRPISLQNFDFDLTRNNTNPKGLEYKIEYTIRKITGNAVPANAGINTSIAISSPRYSFIRGFLGTFDIAVPPSLVQVDIFKNSFQADLFLEDPRLRLYFDNSIGASASVNIPALEVKFNDATVAPRSIMRNSGSFLDTTIASPGLSQIGQTATTEVFYNKNNSNIRNSFNPSPYTVQYSANVKVNPTPGVTQNFVTDQSRVRVRADVELPLEGRINNLVLLDTIKISVENDFQSDYNLDYIIYKLNTENGFPFDCNLQGYFLDSNRVVSDSIVIPGDFLILPSATINNSSGRVTQSSKVYYQQKFEGDRIKNIQNARFILLVGKFNTTRAFSGQNIKIFKDYFVKVRLAAEAKIRIEFDKKD